MTFSMRNCLRDCETIEVDLSMWRHEWRRERSVYLNDANTCQGLSWRAFSAFNPEFFKKKCVAMARFAPCGVCSGAVCIA